MHGETVKFRINKFCLAVLMFYPLLIFVKCLGIFYCPDRTFDVGRWRSVCRNKCNAFLFTSQKNV